jgi:SAM-dependent methyltransferase
VLESDMTNCQDHGEAPHGKDSRMHWQTFARKWGFLGSPLRPCPEDVRVVKEMLGSETDLLDSGTKRHALLLGVTPEIAAARWLEGFQVVAAERDRNMIEAIWPGNSSGRLAVQADWRNAPLPSDRCDLVIGDGCLTVVEFPQGLSEVLGEVRRCLHAEGYLQLRLFCRPEVTETPDQVIAALLSGEIGSIHAFKWRLLMAVQGTDKSPDISVAEVWWIWNEVRSQARSRAEAYGWPPAEVGTMELYRGSAARYNFMTLKATVRELQQAGFELLATRTGTYELAERCPHVLLRKRIHESGGPVA